MEAVVCYYRRTTVNDSYEDELEQVDRRYTYNMHIEQLTDDSFIYVNEYDINYVEKARLIRISKEAEKSSRSSKPNSIKRHVGSMLSNY